MECPSKSDGANTWRSIFRVYRGVVLKVLVKKGPLGIHFLKKGIPTKQGTYIMAILGTGILNNYQIGFRVYKVYRVYRVYRV